MPVSILVVTPHSAFGELLRDSLTDQQDYQVALVPTAKEARSLAKSGSFALAILDAAVDEDRFVPLCREILSLQKGIRLLVIPPDNNPSHSALGGLMPHGYLNRPFYLPDLLETVTRLLYERESEMHIPAELSPKLPEWLQDHDIARRYMEQILPGTQALAALLGIYEEPVGSGKLQINTGQLDDPAAFEVCSVVFRYWNADEKTDLMRFLRLATDKNDYLIYATHLIENLVLILVYNTNAPLSQIRPKTRNFSQQLVSTAPNFSHETAKDAAELQPSAVEVSTPQQPSPQNNPASSPVPAAAEPRTQPLEEAGYGSHLRASFLSYVPEDSEEESAAEAERIDLSALLGTIPSPDPQNDTRGSSLQPDAAAPFSPSITSDRLNLWQVLEDPHSIETAQSHPEADNSTEQSLVEQAENRSLQSTGKDLIPEPEIDPLEDTRPHVVAALTNLGQLEPVSPALSLLNYTCVLVPRLPQHYLTGDLADQLSQWVQQLCLAFGWRLEGISIRPEYLQWTVQVAPSISPGNLVRIVRQRTSLHIFNQFPYLANQNPSGDYWATGYLIVSGAQPPSAQLLREYIAQTRKRQGVIR